MSQNWKKLFAVILAIGMVMSMVVLPVSAESEETQSQTTEPETVEETTGEASEAPQETEAESLEDARENGIDSTDEQPAWDELTRIDTESMFYANINQANQKVWVSYVAEYDGTFVTGIVCEESEAGPAVRATVYDKDTGEVLVTDDGTASSVPGILAWAECELSTGQEVILEICYQDAQAGRLVFGIAELNYILYDSPVPTSINTIPSPRFLPGIARITTGGQRMWIALTPGSWKVRVEDDEADHFLEVRDEAGALVDEASVDTGFEEILDVEEGQSFMFGIGFADETQTGDIFFEIMPAGPKDDFQIPALEEIPELTLNEELSVDLPEIVVPQYCRFTPQENEFYMFRSISENQNNCANLYWYDSESQQYEFITTDDDSGKDMNFMIAESLLAGETYVLELMTYNEPGTFPVQVELSPVVGATVEPIMLYENMIGEYVEINENEEQFRYRWESCLSVTYVLRDGTTQTGMHELFYDHNGEELIFRIQPQDDQKDGLWEIGQHEAEISFLGQTTAVQIQVVEAPEISLTLNPVEIPVSYCWSMEWMDPETGEISFWEIYPWWEYVFGVATVNGEECEIHHSYFEYEGCSYSLQYTDEQSFFSAWSLGGTYEGQVRMGNASATVSVTVVENLEEPDETIVLPETVAILELDTPLTVTDVAGDYAWVKFTPDEDGIYLFYSLDQQNRDTKGTLLILREESGECEILKENDDGYQTLNFQINHKLTAGTTYYLRTGFLDKDREGSYEIAVWKTPVESIQFGSVTSYYRSNGQMNWEAEKGIWWYFHDWMEELTYTVTLTDGTSFTGHGEAFAVPKDGAEWFLKIEHTCDQSPEYEWGPSEEPYKGRVSFDDDYEIAITIIEPLDVSISLDPIQMPEEQEGEMRNENDHEYYHYFWQEKVSGTVTVNGVAYRIENRRVMTDQGELELYFYDDQINNSWFLGNTYGATVGCMGTEVEATVSIISGSSEPSATEIPDAADISQVLQLDTPMVAEITEPGGIAWFVFTAPNTGRYTLESTAVDADPRVDVYGENKIQCGGDDDSAGNLNFRVEQYMTAGETYIYKILLCNEALTASIPIQFSYQNAGNSDGYEFLIQNEQAIITQCVDYNPTLMIPDQLGGYPVTGILSLSPAIEYHTIELVIPDSVTMLGDELLSYAQYLEKVTIGSGVTSLQFEQIVSFTNRLEEIVISDQNTAYASVDGVAYDKNLTTMVIYPTAKTAEHAIPDTVSDITVLFNGRCSGASVQLGAGTAVTDYKQEDGVIYSADMTQVVFCNGNKTGSYVMPNSVTTIAENAFMFSQISEVTISNQVTQIVYNAFNGCTQLVKVVMPDTITSIGDSAFESCINLKELNPSASSPLNLPSMLTDIGYWSMARTALHGVAVIPGTVERVGAYAFYETPITGVVLNEGTKLLERGAFGRTQITSVTLPTSVESMESKVFYQCSELSSVTLNSNITVINDRSFSNTALTSIDLSHVSRVESSAFQGCRELTKVTFSNDAQLFIGHQAFINCPIESLTLPPTTTTLEDMAFHGSALKQVYVPSEVTTIAYKAFANSTQLLEITVSDHLHTLNGYALDNTAWYNAQADGQVYLQNYLYNYKGELPENYHLEIREGTTLLAEEILNCENELVNVTIPDSLTRFPVESFRGCMNLKSIQTGPNSNFYMNGDCLYTNDGAAVWGVVTRVELYESLRRDYALGEPLDLQDSRWMIFHADGQVLQRMVQPDEVFGYDPWAVGEQKITIALGDCAFTFSVYVRGPASINGLTITQAPSKTEYNLNQALRLEDMVVSASYDGGTYQVKESEYKVDGYNPSVPGTQTVFIYHNGYQATFQVTVSGEKVSFAPMNPVVENKYDEMTGQYTEFEHKVEVNAPEGAIGQETVLQTDTVNLGDLVESGVLPQLPAQITESKDSVTFDISLFDTVNNEVTQPENNQAVEVSIRVPGYMNPARCKVFYVDYEGNAHDQSARNENGYMVFSVNHFSLYTLVEEHEPAGAAQIGEEIFDSLEAAVAAAEPGQCVVLLDNTSGGGIVIDKDITIDFNGFSYTILDPTVGSPGTTTCGFQILKDNAVTLENGTLRTGTDSCKILVQNYSNLTLNDMVLDGAGSANMWYVLSSNYGESTVTGNTSIYAPEGAYAMDVYDYTAGGYATPAKLVLNTQGLIVGEITVSPAADLNVQAGNFTCKPDAAWFDAGYGPVANEEGIYTVMETLAYLTDAQGNVLDKFNDLNLALSAAQSGQTLVLERDVQTSVAAIFDGITLDLNGKNLTADGVVAFKGGSLIDSVGTGMAMTHNLSLNADNPQMPVKLEDGYRLVTFQILAAIQNREVDSLTMLFMTQQDQEITQALADGAADNEIEIVAKVYWSCGTSHGTLEFVFGEDLVENVYGYTGSGISVFTLTLNGIEGLTDLEVSAQIQSATGVNASKIA